MADSICLILISSHCRNRSPTVAVAARHLIQAKPIFPPKNAGILTIPLGF
jgi:hypothetical protein